MRNHAIVAFTALLAGCAGTPLVEFKQPGFTLADSDQAPAMTLPEARSVLMKLRGTYHDAMFRQLDAMQMSNASLLVLGAAVTGLAAGRAHPDAIVGMSLFGGTSYALGSMTLDRRRVLAFDAGIKALDCAREAVIPFDLDTATLQALSEATKRLTEARGKGSTASNRVQAAVDKLVALQGIGQGPKAAAERAVGTMNAALAESDKSRKAATKLSSDTRIVGQHLASAVYRISAKVDGVIAGTVQDISAVSQMVSGLGGFASAFAPGAGLDQTFKDFLEKYKSAQTTDVAKSSDPAVTGLLNELATALSELDGANAELIAATAEVDQYLASVDLASVTTALKSCNAADVVEPLAIEPASLAMESKSGSTRGFHISGGTRPYRVRMLDKAPEGLSLSWEGQDADTAQVSAAASVPAGTYRVLVTDGVKNRKVLPVTVSAAADAATTTTTNPGTNTGELTALAKTINGLPPLKLKSATFTVKPDAAVDPQSGKVVVNITCSATNAAQRPKESDLIDKLLADAKASDQIKAKKPLRVKLSNPACVENTP